MGFFDNLTKKTTETTSKIAKKTTEATSKITKETKLKLKISEYKGKINDLYEEIGKKIYENHIKELKDENNGIEELCMQIDDISSQIEEARKEILILNNKKLCKKCFAEIESDAAFCSKCGEKQEEVKSTFEKAEEEIKEVEVLPKNEEKKEAAEIQIEEKITNEEKEETAKKEEDE
ncbi:MAG: zinc ribbon domain-containing protein [Clostridia bacterium]|nr:zinc ribbon domain-containing protein [Clostridia bacterium]